MSAHNQIDPTVLADMARAMNDVNDLDTRHEQFAEAAIGVLQQRGLMQLPEDRLDLMDDLTAAMSDRETGPDWNYPAWHPYAHAIIDVLKARGLTSGI